MVSIHAPVRGATFNVGKMAAVVHVFQSTRPCGARLIDSLGNVLQLEFQSTRPCGARRPKHPAVEQAGAFQSTRPCGARPEQAEQRLADWDVSIHAPVRGATEPRIARELPLIGFNPRARAGRDSPLITY